MKHLPVKTMFRTTFHARMGSGARESCAAINHQANNTKHAAGTLPLHMYRKELPVGEKIATQSTILDSNTDEVKNIENNDEQQSEYDSASDEEDLQAEEMASEVGSDMFETSSDSCELFV